MPNAFVHLELGSTDLEASKEFYTSLFDWELDSIKGANNVDYTLIKIGGGKGGGGMMKQVIPGAPSCWLPYVQVYDIKTATRKAESLGAKILKDCMDVPGQGTLTIMQDPTGAYIGMWQLVG